MALTQEKRGTVSTHAHRIRATKIPTEHDHLARAHQQQLDTRIDAILQKPAAVRDLYIESCAQNPAAPASTACDSLSEAEDATAEVAFIHSDGHSLSGSDEEADLDANQPNGQVEIDGSPDRNNEADGPVDPTSEPSTTHPATLTDTKRRQIAHETGLIPEIIPDDPAVFLEQQKFLREHMYGMEHDSPKRELPPVDSFLHADCTRDLIWVEKHSDSLKDFYIFMRHKDPPMAVSTCDSGSSSNF